MIFTNADLSERPDWQGRVALTVPPANHAAVVAHTTGSEASRTDGRKRLRRWKRSEATTVAPALDRAIIGVNAAGVYGPDRNLPERPLWNTCWREAKSRAPANQRIVQAQTTSQSITGNDV